MNPIQKRQQPLPYSPSNQTINNDYEPIWKQKDVKFKTITKWFTSVLICCLIVELILFILNVSYVSIKFTFSNIGAILSPIPLLGHLLFGFIVWWCFYYLFLRFGKWCRKDENDELIVNIYDPTVIALLCLPLFLLFGELILVASIITAVVVLVCYLIVKCVQ